MSDRISHNEIKNVICNFQHYCLLSRSLFIAPTIIYIDDNEQKPNTKLIAGIGGVAVLAHFVNLTNNLSGVSGIGFTVMNVVSFMCLLMSLVATLALPKWKSIWFPLTIVYILSVVSIALSSFMPIDAVKHFENNYGLLFHITIALLSFAMFFIAMIYAFQLRWLDKRIKSKALLINSKLPPLMTVERHFFTLTFIAEIFMTITLLSGVIYLPSFFSAGQVSKAIFSFLAWIVYGILLFGLWKLHWRGKRVLIYSISGMILLCIGYFGSQF